MLNDQDYELLSAYMDGALAPDERTALEARLAAETELREELEALQSTVALIRALPVREAPRNFTLTRGMVQARRPAPRRFMLTSTAISFVSAAAAVFLIGFSLLLLSGPRAGAPQTSSSVAFSMTNTGFGESDITQKTNEQPPSAPIVADQLTTTELARQNSTEALDQSADGGSITLGSEEAQETAPRETQADGIAANGPVEETVTAEAAIMFAAPAASSVLPEITAEFYYNETQIGTDTDSSAANAASGIMIAPTMQAQATQVAQPPLSESEQPGQPQQDSNSSAEPGQPLPQDFSSSMAQLASETATASPSSTLPPTPTATITATATVTVPPTLTATPVPAVSTSTGTIDAPIIMLVAGILLLAVSGIFYARSRRRI